MSRFNKLFKDYAAFLSLLGLSFVQILTFRPSPQLSLYLVVFSILAIWAVVTCFRMLRAAHLDRRTRQTAAAMLIFTPPVYMILAFFYYIPNIWPIHVQAGAESRVTNPLLKTLHGVSLDLGLRDQEVGTLFVPDKHFFSASPAIHRITIDNRSTVQSPPLKVRVILRLPPGLASPPAVFAAAITSDAVRGWRPFGGSVNLVRSHLFPQQPGTDNAGAWLAFEGWYTDALVARHKGERWWSFIPPPTRVTEWTEWREPEFWLPSIPPRSSLEVYLELALRDQKAATIIPATVEIRAGVTGEFPVTLSQNVDLNAGLDGR